MARFLESEEEFVHFYRAHSRGLVVFFARRTFDAQIAVDLTAETFAAAFAARRSFRGTVDAEAAGWLFGIARRHLARYFENRAADRRMLAKLSVQAPVASDQDIERIENLAELDLLRRAVREQVAILGDDDRRALSLRVLDEEPYAQVAIKLGVSEQAARMRVCRALRTLATALRAQPEIFPEGRVP